jgi:hypothetical protein
MALVPSLGNQGEPRKRSPSEYSRLATSPILPCGYSLWQAQAFGSGRGNGTVRVEITTRDEHALIDALLEGAGPEVRFPGPISAPSGVSASIESVSMHKGVGFPEVVSILMQFGGTVAAGVVVNWLWDKLKRGKAERLSIDRREITLDQGEITRIVDETIRSERER